MEKILSPGKACATSPVCMAGLTCHGWEQNNASAGFKCAQTFQSPEFGDFMECNFVKEQCLDFPEPNEINSASCKGLVCKSQQIQSCYGPFQMGHFMWSISFGPFHMVHFRWAI